MSENWPFSDPKNLAVITLKRIVIQQMPVLVVTHDEDGSWQFLDGNSVNEEDAAIVSIQEMVNRDKSILELATLPLGWRAWRSNPVHRWQTAPSER